MRRSRPLPEDPGPGQESVWSYPRPPVVHDSDELVEVWFAGGQIASTNRSVRILETSQAPAYYLPPQDVDSSVLTRSAKRSWCEWKGHANYYDLQIGSLIAGEAAWYYPDPNSQYKAIRNYISFYPQRVGRCVVDGEEVRANEGGFYGGWVTSKVVGPFKGGAKSLGW